MTKVLIIGAGPSGTTAGRLLAESGFNVTIVEEHARIGAPIQCTGLLTKSIFKFLPKQDIDRYLVNKLSKVEVISKANSAMIDLDEYVICRDKFDNYLAKRAKDAGCEILTKHKFKGTKDNVAKVDNKNIKYDILIGADGPNSAVATSAKLPLSKFIVGSQAVVKGRFDKNKFTTYFGSGFPYFFGWIVPESSSVARVGFAGRHTREQLDRIIKILKGSVIEQQAGLIPIYKRKQVQRNNTYLVGDAAGFVKNTTGGGIIPGIWSAHILAEALSKNKSYESLLRPLRKELFIHRLLRNMLNRFSDTDYDDLISLLNDKEVKRIFRENSRDCPSGLIMRLLLAKPSLIKFAMKPLASKY